MAESLHPSCVIRNVGSKSTDLCHDSVSSAAVGLFFFFSFFFFFIVRRRVCSTQDLIYFVLFDSFIDFFLLLFLVVVFCGFFCFCLGGGVGGSTSVDNEGVCGGDGGGVVVGLPCERLGTKPITQLITGFEPLTSRGGDVGVTL